MPKAVAYLRVSTTDQDVAHQREAAQRWAAYAGVTLEVVEETASGAATSRPALEALLSRCRAGGLSVLWIWALDRLGRRTAALVGLLDELHRLDVRVVSHREGMDYGTESGRLVARIMAAVAEMERERLRERTLSGLNACRDENGKVTRTGSGVPAGQRPFLWQEPAGQEALAWYAEKRAEGWTWPRIAAEGPKVFRVQLEDGKRVERAVQPSSGSIRRELAKFVGS